MTRLFWLVYLILRVCLWKINFVKDAGTWFLEPFWFLNFFTWINFLTSRFELKNLVRHFVVVIILVVKSPKKMFSHYRSNESRAHIRDPFLIKNAGVVSHSQFIKQIAKLCIFTESCLGIKLVLWDISSLCGTFLVCLLQHGFLLF